MLLLDIVAITNQAAPAADKGPDGPALISLMVSVLAFFVSLRTAIQGKRLEIRTRRFERIAIQPVEGGFAALDLLFQQQGAVAAALSRQVLTERVSDVNITLAHIQSIYRKFAYQEVVLAGEDFTEQIFDAPQELLMSYAPGYALWKMQVLDALYTALDKEANKFLLW